MTPGGSAVDSGRAWLAGAICSLAAFSALLTLVLLGQLDGLDHIARAGIFLPEPSTFQSVMQAASFAGGAAGQVVVIVLGSLLLWRSRRRWAVALPIVMAGAGLLQLAAKWAVDRPRPNLDPWGFPSAHVLSTVVLLGCIAYLVGTSALPRRWRALGVGGSAAAVVTVAYSRMALDAHWLSDVLGGFTIGLAYLLLVMWCMRVRPALPSRVAPPLAVAA